MSWLFPVDIHDETGDAAAPTTVEGAMVDMTHFKARHQPPRIYEILTLDAEWSDGIEVRIENRYTGSVHDRVTIAFTTGSDEPPRALLWRGEYERVAFDAKAHRARTWLSFAFNDSIVPADATCWGPTAVVTRNLEGGGQAHDTIGDLVPDEYCGAAAAAAEGGGSATPGRNGVPGPGLGVVMLGAALAARARRRAGNETRNPSRTAGGVPPDEDSSRRAPSCM